MAIRSTGGLDLHRVDIRAPANNQVNHAADESAEHAPVVNLQEELNNAAEEMADLLSAFGRFNRTNRKNVNSNNENESFSAILEDHADEKLNSLIKQVSKLHGQSNILNFARGFFPNDSDLMLALREMLLSRKLSELMKKKVKEAISDLEKFSDRQKMQSGINVGKLARRFSKRGEGKPLSAKDLRSSYLRFLELELPAGFIYQDWIDEFGCSNRKRLLTFTLSALIADMKANEPGIHFDEFGPLSAKLSDARILNTLDNELSESFNSFIFHEQLRNNEGKFISEDDVVGLYMKGLINISDFKPHLSAFSVDYLSLLLVRQRAEVIQALRKVYNMTPDFLFSDVIVKDDVLEMMSSLLTKLCKKERENSVWSEHDKKELSGSLLVR